MNAIVPFNFNTTAIRVQVIEGEPWFVLADVCRVLDLRNVADAAARLADDEKGIALSDTPGGAQEVVIVNEQGLYRLIFRSRKPAAEQFRRWVWADVLPAIRRTGGYGAPAAPIDLTDTATLHRLLLDHTGRTLASEERVAELAPKAAALDQLAEAEGSMPITDAAKALSVPPRRLFAWLEANKWTYRRVDGGPWLAFEAKRQAGVLEHKGRRIEVRGRPDKWVEQVMVTPKGLARLAEVGAGR